MHSDPEPAHMHRPSGRGDNPEGDETRRRTPRDAFEPRRTLASHLSESSGLDGNDKGTEAD
eukprot:7968472-Pyramimonas_sp.AAC.1